GLEALRLWHAGSLVEEHRFDDGADEVRDGFTWNVPTEAAPGAVLALRVEATDASGRRSSAVRRLRVATGVVLEGDQVLDPALLGDELTLGAGRFVLAGASELERLTLLDGAVLTSEAGRPLHLAVGGALHIHCGARIDHDGGGYGAATGLGTESAPLGVAGAQPDAGGSHGGLGGVSGAFGEGAELAAGEVYDSVFEPSMAGAAGAPGLGGPGLAGGGLIVITAGEVRVDGRIVARGAGGDIGRPAGGGGAVWLRTGTLAGHGSLDVSGGDAGACSAAELAGAGGGGRVALDVGVLDGFDPLEQAVAAGGAQRSCDGAASGHAGAGTIFFREAGSHGTLAVIQPAGGALPVAATPLPQLGTGVVGRVGAERSRTPTAEGGLWIEPLDPFRRFDLGLWGLDIAIGGSEYRVVDQSADRRRLLLEGAEGRVEAGDLFAGVYRFDRVVVRGGARLEIGDGVDATSFEVDEASSLVRGPDPEPAADATSRGAVGEAP
ncbi:MAG: hypothetical protein KDD11_05950, partial [Acidobacteria bacterium]|nr:hypothetical protein [Acidobacteriota bacterium]